MPGQSERCWATDDPKQPNASARLNAVPVCESRNQKSADVSVGALKLRCLTMYLYIARFRCPRACIQRSYGSLCENYAPLGYRSLSGAVRNGPSVITSMLRLLGEGGLGQLQQCTSDQCHEGSPYGRNYLAKLATPQSFAGFEPVRAAPTPYASTSAFCRPLMQFGLRA